MKDYVCPPSLPHSVGPLHTGLPRPLLRVERQLPHRLQLHRRRLRVSLLARRSVHYAASQVQVRRDDQQPLARRHPGGFLAPFALLHRRTRGNGFAGGRQRGGGCGRRGLFRRGVAVQPRIERIRDVASQRVADGHGDRRAGDAGRQAAEGIASGDAQRPEKTVGAHRRLSAPSGTGESGSQTIGGGERTHARHAIVCALGVGGAVLVADGQLTGAGAR